MVPQATFHFPRGFLWGTATAAHQVEGNNTNNQWWKWEQEGHTNGTSGLACDWWGGRWREDFDRAAEAGQNAHRMSVEWSRIQPTPDTWDETALEKYRALWCTVNEPNGYALNGYIAGVGEWPPGKHDLKLGFRVLANLVRG